MTLLEAMQQVKVNDTIVKEYVINFRYTGDTYWFRKNIYCECLKEAIKDAKSFINERNAQVAGKPKVGNYINRAEVFAWDNWAKERVYLDF